MPSGDVIGFGHQHFHVFGRDRVDEVDGGVLVLQRGKRCRASRSPARAIAFRSRDVELHLDFIEHRGRQAFRPADQPDAGHFVVLGLREKICGDPRRIAGFIGDDSDFAGPGRHVDVDSPVDHALRSLNVRVAGTDDLVDARNGFRSVGQRCDRLGAADAIDLVQIPSRSSAAATSGFSSSALGGVTTTIRSTPATCAGIAFISTEEG